MISKENSERDVIAVDIDEVLAYFMPSLVNFHNETYGVTSNDINEFHKVWGGTPYEALQKMEHFFESIHFKEQIVPIASAYPILQQLTKEYSLHVVTARQTKLEEITRKWIQKYFPNIFQEIHFGNHYSTSGKSRSKVEMCQLIKAKLLIDDSLVYATQCCKQGIQVILFGNYAWNQVRENLVASYNPQMIGMAKNETANTTVTSLASIETTAVKGSEDKSANNTGSYAASDIQQIDTVKVVKYNGDLYPSNGSIGDEKIVYRVAEWEKVQRLIYQLIPPKQSYHSNSKRSNVKELNVFAIQLCSVNDKLQNLQQIQRTIEEIASRHFPKKNDSDQSSNEEEEEVNIVCLPECCVFMGNNSDETVSASEILCSVGNSLNNLRLLGKLAKQYHIWLSVGGFPERNPSNNEKMFNTQLIINPDGKVEADSVYRKIHLFDCPLVGLQESKLTDAGDTIKVINIHGWNIGLTICYDLRFPLLYQKLREEHNIDAVLVPSAFTVPTGKAHWEILLRARAIENQCYVVAAAQAGKHNAKRESYGHSMIVDPWGAIGKSLSTLVEQYQ